MTNEVLRPLGLDVAIYVVDYEQQTLRPLPEPGRTMPEPLSIEDSAGGRAFQTIAIVPDQDRHRVWIPVVDGTERLGVMAVDLPSSWERADAMLLDELRAVAALVGHLIQAKSALGDTIEVARRTQPMSVASELVRRLPPPSTFACDRLAVAALLEPSYHAGGDVYDYSVHGDQATLTLLDALGHGTSAALTASLALSALRAARRSGLTLAEMTQAADVAMIDEWDDSRFATAFLAKLDLGLGLLRFINAGHPPPALVRGGRVVALLDGGRRLPLGLKDEVPVPAEIRLEPGDRLLCYTDGVIEARDPQGTLFGLERLGRLVEEHSALALPTAEVLRRLSRAVREHRDGVIQDDATLMLIEWQSDSAATAVP